MPALWHLFRLLVSDNLGRATRPLASMSYKCCTTRQRPLRMLTWGANAPMQMQEKKKRKKRRRRRRRKRRKKRRKRKNLTLSSVLWYNGMILYSLLSTLGANGPYSVPLSIQYMRLLMHFENVQKAGFPHHSPTNPTRVNCVGLSIYPLLSLRGSRMAPRCRRWEMI